MGFRENCSLDSFYKFLSPEIALYPYKSTIRPCMEYSCHIWTGAPSCYLVLLDKLQKQICRIVGPSIAASLEPLAHHRNVASLFHSNYFGRCSSELTQLVTLPYFRGRSSRYSRDPTQKNQIFLRFDAIFVCRFYAFLC